MSDLPPGDWSSLLVGRHWPDSASLSTLGLSAENRHRFGQASISHAKKLRETRDLHLAAQEGATADRIRAIFNAGEQRSLDSADKNLVKSRSYTAAMQSLQALRDDLYEIASGGNESIDRVQASQNPLSVKVTQITDIIYRANIEADSQAARRIEDIYSYIQAVVDAEGVGSSARSFAAGHGTEPERLGTVIENLAKEVSAKIDRIGSAESIDSSSNSKVVASSTLETIASGTSNAESPLIGSPGPSPRPFLDGGTSKTIESGYQSELGQSAPRISSSPASTPAVQAGTMPDLGTGPSATAAAPPQNLVTAISVPDRGAASGRLTNGVLPTAYGANPETRITSTPTPPHTPHFSLNDLVSPNDLAEGFSAGNQTGAPISAGAEALSAAATAPVHSQLPAHVPALEDPATPIFENAHAAPPPATAAPAAPPPSDTAPPVITAAPAIAPIQQIPAVAPAIAATPAPASGLLAYGADIKPTAAPVPPPTIAAGAPAPAPNSTTAGAHTGQPSLVRQQPLTAAHPPPTAGLAEKAIAATAAGSAAGAGAAHSAATHRLRRLLDTITRQEPQLRWAIGDLDDGTTRLVTDLAGGWVPPGISIPTGVRLRHPANRRGGLRALLGPTVLSLTYNPGRQLEETRDSHPVPTSVRARDVTPISDLGWELSRATKWRDGLPRLAHTLARAAAAETGCLATEVEALHACIKEVADEVKTAYPKAVDATRVGDWQLLATILALVNGERTLANYHFAWFQTHAMTTAGDHDR